MLWCVVKHRDSRCLVQHDIPQHRRQNLTDANWCSPRHVTVSASTEVAKHHS